MPHINDEQAKQLAEWKKSKGQEFLLTPQTERDRKEEKQPGSLTGSLSLFIAICSVLCACSSLLDPLSMFFLTQVFAVVAVFFGLISLVRSRKNHRDYKSRIRRIAPVFFLIVFALMMLTLARPKWREATEFRNLNHCESNLCFIRSGKEQYEMANPGLTNGTVITREQLAPYIKGKWDFICFPSGKDTYNIGRVGEEPSCSIHGSSGCWHFSDGFPEFSDQVIGVVIEDVATNGALQKLRDTYGSSRCIKVHFAFDSCGSIIRSSTLRSSGVNCWSEIGGYKIIKDGYAPVDSMEVRIDKFKPTTPSGSNIEVTVSISSLLKKGRASLIYVVRWNESETGDNRIPQLVNWKDN